MVKSTQRHDGTYRAVYNDGSQAARVTGLWARETAAYCGGGGRMSALAPILAVDDSAPMREMIVAVLAPRGHRVATAANGREALDRLNAAVEPYIVLLDLVMPILDGI